MQQLTSTNIKGIYKITIPNRVIGTFLCFVSDIVWRAKNKNKGLQLVSVNSKAQILVITLRMIGYNIGSIQSLEYRTVFKRKQILLSMICLILKPFLGSVLVLGMSNGASIVLFIVFGNGNRPRQEKPDNMLYEYKWVIRIKPY